MSILMHTIPTCVKPKKERKKREKPASSDDDGPSIPKEKKPRKQSEKKKKPTDIVPDKFSDDFEENLFVRQTLLVNGVSQIFPVKPDHAILVGLRKFGACVIKKFYVDPTTSCYSLVDRTVSFSDYAKRLKQDVADLNVKFCEIYYETIEAINTWIRQQFFSQTETALPDTRDCFYSIVNLSIHTSERRTIEQVLSYLKQLEDAFMNFKKEYCAEFKTDSFNYVEGKASITSMMMFCDLIRQRNQLLETFKEETSECMRNVMKAIW